MKKIDAMGKQCPIPVIEAKKALEKLAKGESVQIFVDNEIAVQNLKKLAEQKHCMAEEEQKAEYEYAVTITAGETITLESSIEQTEKKAEKEYEDCCAVKEKIVVISSDQMGNGAEELGKTLIKGFIYALTEQDLDAMPSAMLFYNRGAGLTCEGSDSLEDLKLLESQGVTIMTCGTCLNYYGLSEKLAIGSTTNMYAIAQTMMRADLIVKP